MQIVSWQFAWNVKAYSLEKLRKKKIKMLSAEIFTQIAKC